MMMQILAKARRRDESLRDMVKRITAEQIAGFEDLAVREFDRRVRAGDDEEEAAFDALCHWVAAPPFVAPRDPLEE